LRDRRAVTSLAAEVGHMTSQLICKHWHHLEW